MPRRTLYDPLAPIPAVTWLVVQDSYRHTLEVRELPPRADLRAILMAARQARVNDGWEATELGRVDSAFFCSHGGVRLQVGIQRCDPAQPMPRGHSDYGRR